MKKSLLTAIGFGILSAWMVNTAVATTMYNTYTTEEVRNGDDGYNNRGGFRDATSSGWLGTSGWSVTGGNLGGSGGGSLPFGLNKSELPIANWAVHLNKKNDTATVSSQNAFESYGFRADIDTTQGAWNDKYDRGAMYSMDLGLFKSDITQKVIMTAKNTTPSSWQTFGINIYTGSNQLHPKILFEYSHDTCCDTNGDPVPVYDKETFNYLSTFSHYGYWGQPGNDYEATPLTNDPFNSDHIDLLVSNDQSTASFIAEAGDIYIVILGGNSGGDAYGVNEEYSLTISSSPVPIPGAVWLFCTACAGLFNVQRNKRNA